MTPETPPPAIVWPAPKEEIPSPDFTVEAAGLPVFVYQARVRARILEKPGLWSHTPDPEGERASFALFDLAAPCEIAVRPARPFATAAVWPASAGVTPAVSNGVIRFRLDKPRHLTVLLDGSDREALHLFVGTPEKDAPEPGAPGVLYFGPGTHRITTLEVKSGQTLYLAPGSVLKAALEPDAKGRWDEKWQVTFHGGAVVSCRNAKNAAIRGRGILDASLLPHPARSMIKVEGSSNIRLEGVTLRDAANWNVTLSGSEDVAVDDLRIVSGRLNSDGINSCNSRRVTVRNCFVRNHDDGIVVKTLQPDKPAEDIAVENCALWADWGFALGVTYETRSPIRRIRFRDCAVVYARHWCLGVRVCDSATISDVAFENIEIGDYRSGPGGAHNALTHKQQLLWLGIVKDVWGKDAEAGRIRDVRIENVTVHGPALPPSEIKGFDEAHPVEEVLLRNIRLAGRPPAADAAALGLRTNTFVRGIRVEP